MTGPQSESGSAPAVLRAVRISKHFGSVSALQDVSLEVQAGRVTCLLGDNGAGKSTLIKILSGVHLPSDGQLLLDGIPVRFRDPRDALAHGIATVYQDLALIPLMSIWRNFYLGREPTRGWGPLRRIDVRTCRASALAALEEFGIRVTDAERPVGTLSGGERQAIAIARTVHRGARVLILDEPTAALGVRQTALVLDVIRRVRSSGVAVVFITHDVAQAETVGDHWMTLERGRVMERR